MIIEYWIENETKIFESDCFLAIAKINNATNMKQVKLATGVYAPHSIRYIQHSIPEYKRMHLVAENKMNDLGNKQVKELEEIICKEEAIQELARLKSTEWQSLRGDYANIYRRLERKCAEIIHKKTVDTKIT